MKIMLCFVLLIILLDRCTSLTGRVCRGEGWVYCCSDSEDVNGHCVECGLGFTAVMSKRCIPCRYPSFGYKCTYECKCKNNQRCDNAVGCVDIPTTEDTTEGSISTLAAKITSDIATYSDSETSQHSIQTSSIKTVLTESSKVDIGLGDKKETKSDFSVREVIVYTAAVAFLMLVMGMCYLVNKYRIILHTRQLKITQQTADNRPLNKNDDIVEMVDDDEDDEELYDEINESEVNDSVFKVPANNAYLEIIDGPSNSEIGNNDNGYLTPIPSSKDESKVVPHLNDLSPNMHILHKPQIHRLDLDSGSSSESIVRNEGYLNPYQPLREIYTSISHRYEIPRIYGSMKNLSELRNKYQNSRHHQEVYDGEQIGTTRINQHFAPWFDDKGLSNFTCRNKQEVDIPADTYYTDCLSKLVKKGRIHNIKSGSI